MKAPSKSISRRTLAITSPVLAFFFTFAGFGMTVDNATAQTKKTEYSSMVDWNLKAENLKPTGINPYYQPLIPGHTYTMINPHFDDDGVKGYYKKDVVVTQEVETFDIAAIGGKFDCAIVEEREFLDGNQFSFSKNYYCFDQSNSTIYTMGEHAWEKKHDKFDMKDAVSESWIAGEPDDNGQIEAGLIFPGTFLLGSKWIIDGAEGKAFVGGEAAESGISIGTPAGHFENCVRTREYDILDPKDVTDKIWCYGVGLVFDTSDGHLNYTSHLGGRLPEPTPYYAYHKSNSNGSVDKDGTSIPKVKTASMDPTVTSEPKYIAEDELKAIAVKAVPGKVMDIQIEKKLGRKTYVVEVIADADGAETDVIVDMKTGEVLATEK